MEFCGDINATPQNWDRVGEFMGRIDTDNSNSIDPEEAKEFYIANCAHMLPDDFSDSESGSGSGGFPDGECPKPEEAKMIFGHLDINGDKTITADEAEEAISGFCKSDAGAEEEFCGPVNDGDWSEVEGFLSSIDKDNSESITEHEAKMFYMKHCGHML